MYVSPKQARITIFFVQVMDIRRESTTKEETIERDFAESRDERSWDMTCGTEKETICNVISEEHRKKADDDRSFVS